VTLDRGTVVLVELDPTVGHEQRGVRPCIAVVPVTGTSGVGALYPALSAGTSGLTKASYALVDHVRSIDKRRVRRIFGQVLSGELAGIDQGLELFLGLGAA